MTALQSSQNFVRALKSPSDPPVQGGLLKIQVARQAWDDASFYVPSKAELLVDWILSKFLKEKGNQLSENPLLDIQYWKLLSDVLLSYDATPTPVNSRPMRTWLIPLLHRIPAGSIVLSFLGLLEKVDQDARLSLYSVASSSLCIIWPVTVQKTSTELLLDCWGKILYLLTECDQIKVLSPLSNLITTSYRYSFANLSNRKKLHSNFMQSYFQSWLKCIKANPKIESSKFLFQTVYDGGIETLFNIDTLRQYQDTKSQNSVFDVLQMISSESALDLLPRIFTSYIESLKKYHGVLFSQGSNHLLETATIELHSTAMRFFISCNRIWEDVSVDLQPWATQLALLSIVYQEDLFHRNNLEAGIALNRIVESAYDSLAVNHTATNAAPTTLPIQCLTVIARIDYDLILPALQRLLPRLLLISDPHPKYFEFLGLLVNYHVKTRTMDTYVINILSALQSTCTSSLDVNARDLYQICFSGPLLHETHLEQVSINLQRFLTPSQCIGTVKAINEHLVADWDTYNTSFETGAEPSPKRRKTEAAASPLPGPDLIALSFSLTAKFSSALLSSLPVQSLLSGSVIEVTKLLAEQRDIFLNTCIKRCLKLGKQGKEPNVWSTQVITTAALRLQYALYICNTPNLPENRPAKLVEKLQSLLDTNNLLPEHRVEIFRSLLLHSHLKTFSNTQATIDKLLEYLETHAWNSDIFWSGQQHCLSFGEDLEGSLSLLHMVLQRWLPDIDSLATSAQLDRLIRIVMKINTMQVSDLHPSPELRPRDLLAMVLHDAQFWELPNIRTVLLAYIDETTSVIEAKKSSSSKLLPGVATYRLLLQFPMEYLSRVARIDLIKRALLADRLVSKLPLGEHNLLSDSLTILRVFLERIFSQTGAIEQQTSALLLGYVEHLMAELETIQSPSNALISVSVNLAGLCFQNLFKLSQKDGTSHVLMLISSFQEQNIFKSMTTIKFSCFLKFIDFLTADVLLTILSDEIQVSLLNLYNHLAICASPLMSADDHIFDREQLLLGWHSLLTFGKWLGLIENIPRFGRHLIREFITGSLSSRRRRDEIGVTILAILLQELYLYPDDLRKKQLELVVATYVSFSAIVQPNAQIQMDSYIKKLSKSLAPDEFAHILGFISKSLSSDDTSYEELIHLSIILLRERPQNTSKHMQIFTTQCINTFVNKDVFVTGPIPLRIQVLEFAVQLCQDHPATIRLIDLGNIWLLLFKLLAPSTSHDEDTTLEVFHKIVAVVIALVRLRRDLITHMLPHLGMILRQLLLATRSCYPHLGAKQTALVVGSLPRWINISHPLGAEEGKSLSRLLEALETKTVPRNNASGSATQKVESLAKPFSKHSAYVLMAYIDAMNDPLCMLPLEVRKELQPGLHALCNIMSEHSRDAMMVSALNAGGKETMKALWRAYEKQKYVGKG